MKTIFKSILAVAVLASAAFVSCNKNNDPYGDKDDYVANPVETPVYAKEAVVVDLSGNPCNHQEGRNA